MATAHSHAFEVSVPGADGHAAGVANVTVRPTHRRRGLLTALMRRQLDDTHGRGEPLACLWASEAPIYRRFGYGLATRGLRWQLDRAGASFAPGPDAGALEARLMTPADARSTLARRKTGSSITRKQASTGGRGAESRPRTARSMETLRTRAPSG